MRIRPPALHDGTPPASVSRVGTRRVGVLAALVLLLAIAEAGVLARTFSRRAAMATTSAESGELARALGLTDLAVWTEARYTRHPGLADFFSAFQDHPGAMEHFPAGSLLAAPPHLLPSSADTGTDR